MAGYHSTAVVPAVGPNFCSLVRTMFVRKFFHLVVAETVTRHGVGDTTRSRTCGTRSSWKSGCGGGRL